MEMNNNGTLIMPSNSIALGEEEMTYLNGGTAKMLAKNIGGLLQSLGISAVNRASYGIPGFATIAAMTLPGACAALGLPIVNLSVLTANPAFIAAAAIGTVGAVTVLWNKKVFY